MANRSVASRTRRFPAEELLHPDDDFENQLFLVPRWGGVFCSPVIIVSIYRGPMSGGTENCTRKLIPGAFKLWFRVGRVIVFGFVHVVQNFVLL